MKSLVMSDTQFIIDGVDVSDRVVSVTLEFLDGSTMVRESAKETNERLILDSEDCWREVEFISNHKGGEHAARERCRALNRAA